jgi:hypothetical protein
MPNARVQARRRASADVAWNPLLGRLLRVVAHGFKVVAIKIDNEGTVVVGMVYLSDSRWPIVFSPGF